MPWILIASLIVLKFKKINKIICFIFAHNYADINENVKNYKPLEEIGNIKHQPVSPISSMSYLCTRSSST